MKGRYCLLALILLLAACSEDSAVLKPSGFAVGVPSAGTPFSSYIADAESRIYSALMKAQYGHEAEPFGPGYPIGKVVAMRAPYELRPDSARCSGGERSGFLLVHGLTDSPYLLRGFAESLHKRYPCALLRGILLPGHGTVPGDTLKMQREDWQAAVDYGVSSLRNEVDKLYLVGFSLGTALALDYVDRHRNEPVQGLILLSPALVAGNAYAWLSPYARWLQSWTGASEEVDAARYRSLSLNAAAEFYLATRHLTDADFAPVEVPVFMVATGDDTTVQSEPARQFFCDRIPAGQRQMLWYESERPESAPLVLCPGIHVTSGAMPESRTYSMSHVAIPVPPEDPHYGLDGTFSRCLRLGAGEEQRVCREEESRVVFGENNLGVEGLYEGRRVRRGTFNPYYEQMLEQTACFIDGDC